jgi:DNA polymerase
MSKALDSLLGTSVYDQPANAFDIAPTPPSSRPVLNENSTLAQPYRIAVIGDAPGRDEEIQGKPFVGMAGKMLNNLLQHAGIVRAACFVGNICQHRPPNNDIKRFALDGPEIQSGVAQLSKDLEAYNPHICLLLGNTPLRFAKDNASVGDWRGSFFISDKTGPFYGRKCIASYHPAACMRMYEWTHLLRLDIKKCMSEASSPILLLPQRNLTINLTAYEIVSRLQFIIANHSTISIDIEGGIGTMSCISVAISHTDSFIIPFTKSNGDSYWSLDDELLIWTQLADVLANPGVGKILQNCLYDRFVLEYSYNCSVIGTIEDTMLKSWEKYCELEKGLGFLCSIYTKEPYYKSDRKSGDMETHWRYCCKDSAVTYEIADKVSSMLDANATRHYNFNLNLLNSILYMELRGIKYDSVLAKQRLDEVNTHIFNLQTELDSLAGVGISSTEDKSKLLERVRDAMCYKKNRCQPKKDYELIYPLIENFLSNGEPLTTFWRGFISIESGFSLNLRSPQFKSYIYDTLKLPKQYKEDPNTGKEALSTDYESLLKIQKKTPHRVIEIALQLGALRTRSQMLEIHADSDGRIRCGYNIVGTETGRLTCYTSPTGSGYNLQTIPSDSSTEPDNSPLKKGMRDLFIADEGYYMFQCDLSGADGWTVAAHLAALGDRTMLEDYLAGIKPAKVLCYMLRHGASSLAGKTREEIKFLTGPIKSKDWDYFLSKIGQHGTSYLMGPQALANNVFKQSEGKLVCSKAEAEDLQKLFNIRYRVRLWHNATAHKLSKSPTITAASGHTRRFFGRSQEILGQALAHEPQANTTYATNLAAWRLWNDNDNRRRDTNCAKVTLRIEPLHQVHDALLGQFKVEDAAWAAGKIKSYFDNKITIAGISLVIPYEGNYGSSWGDLSIGSI